MRNSHRRAARAAAALLALALTASVVSACGDSEADDAEESRGDGAATQPVAVTDDTGVEIALDEPVERIACLTMICVDALTEVGITPVAYRDALALDERYAGPDADMREITGGFGEENVEDVALATPDLVIGLAGAQDGLRPAVERIAPLYLVDPRSWQGSVDFLRTVGDLTGTRERADERADAFTERVEEAAAERSELTTLSMYGEPGSLGVDSVETPVGSLLAEVSDYPWPAAADPFASIAVEQIAKADPDLVFAQAFSASDDTEPLSERLASDPVWAGMTAAREGRVVEVEAPMWATGRGTISLGLVLDTVEAELD
ncbi:ABC transporter substrate-binding protein [Nocardioides lianchengensis]|uniref:Iron complex transport system substrate-binding protein n=1 Tax=Nocardioides lianchengensis TaxID=1045774 RepID=A0A1G6W0E6_9ACTN|nr:ABC transporter substrate-binding protein [Nocardioides lianchengensis]NYG09487.1 iron complex transport system substrate-binding protein [Nocardioides lianchengensis]SDD59291.1 iron complex transport system substrate-binding protein [Nocardioides lianchengensis]